MDNLALGEVIDLCKRGVLWIIVTVIFTTKELKDEAGRHCYSGVIRIPGVCLRFQPGQRISSHRTTISSSLPGRPSGLYPGLCKVSPDYDLRARPHSAHGQVLLAILFNPLYGFIQAGGVSRRGSASFCLCSRSISTVRIPMLWAPLISTSASSPI